MPRDEKIDLLSLGLRNMAHRRSTNDHSPEVDHIYQNLKTTLLAIPGHAEYFGNQIKVAREEAIIGNEKSAKLGEKPNWPGFDNVRLRAIQKLGQMPSPEAVKVLGELLNDLQVTYEIDLDNFTADSFGLPSNASLAADELKSLIENPPVPKDRDHQLPGDIPAWQAWYEQVKSGHRTFRFQGDSTEYDLNGPASKELLQRVERDRKRDEERATGHKKSSVAPQSKISATQNRQLPSVAWLVAAIGLCAAAVWYFVKGRKTA